MSLCQLAYTETTLAAILVHEEDVQANPRIKRGHVRISSQGEVYSRQVMSPLNHPSTRPCEHYQGPHIHYSLPHNNIRTLYRGVHI